MVGNHGYNTNANPKLSDAIKKGIDMCSQNDTGCQVYYSDCSLPKQTPQ